MFQAPNSCVTVGLTAGYLPCQLPPTHPCHHYPWAMSLVQPSLQADCVTLCTPLACPLKVYQAPNNYSHK